MITVNVLSLSNIFFAKRNDKSLPHTKIVKSNSKQHSKKATHKKNTSQHICSFLTLLFLKSLCQSSIFTQHKILTYWKQKHSSLLLLQTKFPWSYNHNNYYYNNIIKTIDGTLWKLTLTLPNIMNVAPMGSSLFF